jgi:hypothetical protein
MYLAPTKKLKTVVKKEVSAIARVILPLAKQLQPAQSRLVRQLLQLKILQLILRQLKRMGTRSRQSSDVANES